MTTAIAVTAHHDDAVLWLGGTILRTRQLGWSWTVIALCVPDVEKRAYFENYCAAVGASPALYQFADHQGDAPFSINSKEHVRGAISEVLRNLTVDLLFTHSRDDSCEYSVHANHVEAREATLEVVRSGEVCSDLSPIAHFSYEAIYGGNGRATVAKPSSDFFLQLTYDELIQKCAWCMAAPDAFTSLKALAYPCPNPEAFAGTALSLPQPFISR